MKPINLLVTVLLLSAWGCGKDGGGSGSNRQEEQVARNTAEATPGTYYTVLRPVNFRSNGFIPYGMASFSLQSDQLKVSVSLDDDQPVVHRQALHAGSRCPTMSDDTNQDGFVDYQEALRVVGPAIMPMDSDLNSQIAGKDQFPRGRAMTYNNQASLAKINADLWAADEDPSDDVAKLAHGSGIGFEGRVVLVHGTTNQNNFPTSLASYNNEPAHLSLPIVCGLLKKVE